jgi:hypothetical protein
MRTPETEVKLAIHEARSAAPECGLRGSIERILVPLKEGILPLILSASSGFRYPILAVPVLLYPLHRLALARTRIH